MYEAAGLQFASYESDNAFGVRARFGWAPRQRIIGAGMGLVKMSVAKLAVRAQISRRELRLCVVGGESMPVAMYEACLEVLRAAGCGFWPRKSPEFRGVFLTGPREPEAIILNPTDKVRAWL